MNVIEFYSACRQEPANDCKQSLVQTDWFFSHVKLDPRSGDALPQTMTSFLVDLQKQKESIVCKDRLWRIIDHCRDSLTHIFRSLNENPHREHAQLPLHSVRELDASCFMKLSNRPGRTIREKVSGNPYIQAVRHYQSIDLTENRLVKAFSERILELLMLKSECLNEPEDEAIVTIQKWLNTDEAKQIGRWDNIPPNNTLLSHRDYRRVWDSWRWLQSLDENLSKDVLNVTHRRNVIDFWSKLSSAYQYEKFSLAEMPLDIDFEEFYIKPWNSLPIYGVVDKIIHRFNYGDNIPAVSGAKKSIQRQFKEKDLVCMDLTEINPVYFTESLANPTKLPYRMIWQDWKNTTIDVFDGDFVYKNDDNETVSIIDLFTSTNISATTLKRAAAEFANKLKSNFENKNLIWLVPDHLDDFELDTIRRNINLVFPNAEPLPRSIASIFENFDAICDNINAEGLWGKEYSLIVKDNILGKKNAIKIDVTFDEEVRKKNPASRGIVFARHPCIELNEVQKNGCAYASIDLNGTFTDFEPIKSSKERNLNLAALGKIRGCLEINDSPVKGGLELKKLQGEHNNVPLWCDYLPELSTRLPDKKGTMHHEFFVGKDKKIQAKRGVSTKIDVGFKFTIPAGKKIVRLPLFKGDGNVKTNYVAILESNQLPFAEDVKCRLSLTYTYGVNDPYELIFIPENAKYRPITIKWFNEKDVPIDISTLPVPEFPPKKGWNEYDLEGVINKLEILGVTMVPYKGEILKDRIDKNGYRYFIISCGEAGVYCSGKNVTPAPPSEDMCGRTIYFHLAASEGDKYSATKASFFRDKLDLKSGFVRYPLIMLWNYGRSLTDASAPNSFRVKMMKILKDYEEKLNDPDMTSFERSKIAAVCSIMHKDAPKFAWDYIEALLHKPEWHPAEVRYLAYAMGDLSLPIQDKILGRVVEGAVDKNTTSARECLASLSIAIWRHENVLQKLTSSELRSLCSALIQWFYQLNAQCSKINWKYIEQQKIFCREHGSKNQGKSRYTKKCCSLATKIFGFSNSESNVDSLGLSKEDLEKIGFKLTSINEVLVEISNAIDLLFALIRTRKSGDPTIQSLFDPKKHLTSECIKQINIFQKLVLEKQLKLKTRVVIAEKESKSKEQTMFDALTMYLNGDDAANSIRISIDDSEDSEE